MYLYSLYVVAFLISSPPVLSGVSGYTTVVVSSNGINKESCITGANKVCKTLDYALQELSANHLDTKDVTLIVEYSHSIQSVNISYFFHLNITVLGVGQPTMHCSEEAFLHFSVQEQSSVTIFFEGVSFSGCSGYFNNETLEWVSGFAFKNFDIVSLRKVAIAKSSDVTLERNRKVSIAFCGFNEMVYHYGVIYIHENVTTAKARNGSNNAISNSAFTGNIGIHGNATPIGTVGVSIESSDSQMIFSLNVS